MLLRKYQGGGTNPPPTDVYEGGEGWENYVKGQPAQAQYDSFNNESTAMANTGQYTNPTQFTTAQFQANNPDFTNVKGATGVTRYNYDSSNTDVYTPKQHVFSSPKTGYTYIPTFDKPATQYNVVENPAVIKQRKEAAVWDKANLDNGIKGYTVTRFVNPQTNKWEEEYRSTKQAQGNRNNAVYKTPQSMTTDMIQRIIGGAPTSPAEVATLRSGGLLETPRFMRGGLLSIKYQNGGSIGSGIKRREATPVPNSPVMPDHMKDKTKTKSSKLKLPSKDDSILEQLARVDKSIDVTLSAIFYQDKPDYTNLDRYESRQRALVDKLSKEGRNKYFGK